MSMEYCVQARQLNGVWSPIDATFNNNISLVKREMNIIGAATGNNAKLRLACREVGDWCEFKEAK